MRLGAAPVLMGRDTCHLPLWPEDSLRVKTWFYGPCSLPGTDSLAHGVLRIQTMDGGGREGGKVGEEVGVSEGGMGGSARET